MGARFRGVDRDQLFLMPPDVREWLPVGHPALFVVEVVESLDLSGFVEASRTSREFGRPAYHPEVMVGVVLYASMVGVVSSRRIERALCTDVGFRVVAANQCPDHVTICRFIGRHGDQLCEVFAQVVALAVDAGLVDVSVVAVDGTKMPGSASLSRNRRLGELREQFSVWAEQVAVNDAADDVAEADGVVSGPIPEMSDPEARRSWIRRRLAEHDGDDDRTVNLTDPDSAVLPRSGGGWVQGYNAQAAAVEGGIVIAADVCASPADSTMLDTMVATITAAAHTAAGEIPAVVVADAGYWNAAVIDAIDTDPERPDVLVATGRQLPDGPPEPLPVPDVAGYERAVAAHTALIEAEQDRREAVIRQVVAGELLIREGAALLGLSVPLVGGLKLRYQQAGRAGLRTPQIAGRPPPPKPPTRAARQRWAMNDRLARPAGRSIYRQRQSIIEPVFGDIKTNRRITRFLRRSTDKVRTEWHWILTGHNLTILHHHR